MGKGGSEQRAATSFLGNPGNPGNPGGSRNELQIVQNVCFYSNKYSDLTPVQCFFDFSIPHSSNTHSFESLGEDCLPEMLSKLGVLAERGMKKSTKTSRDSSGGLGGCGGLGQLWEALAELWDPTLFSNVQSSQCSI